jgi:hypothetical protein
LETFGLLLVAFLFAFSGYNHVKNHAVVAGYAATAFGDCPIATQLGYLGGWPTGVLLLGTAVGLILQYTLALYVAIGFLAVTQALFHRNLKDPANAKHLALIGSLVALAAVVA